MDVVRELCAAHHGYGSAGNVAVYAFAVLEPGRGPVAAYAWQPPPPGCARSVCPECPAGVLSLSRMIAVPKANRTLKHVSKPLREQVRKHIDRTRWPVLVTFSDEGEGHTGYVYACAGWEKTERRLAVVMRDADGRRASRYSNGKTGGRPLVRGESTYIQRWEKWACARGDAAKWMQDHGWRRVPNGRTYRSGAAAFSWVKDPDVSSPE